MLSRDKDLLKMFLLVIFILTLQGCGSTGSLDITGKAIDKFPDDMGRMSAWAAVVSMEEKTAQKKYDAEIAKAQAEEAKDKATTLVLDTAENFYIYSMAQANKTMGQIALALAKRDEKSPSRTPMPKGVIGESLDSLGDAVTKVANSPGAIVAGVGWAVSRTAAAGFKAAGDTTNTGGDVNTITGDENTSTVERNQVTATTAGAESAATATP